MHSPETRETIGRYAVERLLGKGAMGTVVLARDPQLDRAVAIKTVRYGGLPPEQLSTFLERFRNEARAAARLLHPNVVQVFDVGEEPGVGPYVVFEYVPGLSLKQRLRQRGTLDAEGVVRLADEVAAALAVAHAAGIVHRDIKPDNLLFTEQGAVKLADFGVARIPDADLTREGQFLGTPCYAAPETLASGVYGSGTDAFSFASVLYECITGARAFPGDDAIGVAHKVMHDAVPPPSLVSSAPRELDAVFEQALAKEPTARFADAQALARAVREAYEAAGVLPRPGGREPTAPFPLDPVEAPAESSFARAAVVLGLVAVGVALVLAFQHEAKPPLSPDASLVPALRDDPPRPLRPGRSRRPRRDAGVATSPTAAPSAAPAPSAPAPSPTPGAPAEAPTPSAPTSPGGTPP